MPARMHWPDHVELRRSFRAFRQLPRKCGVSVDAAAARIVIKYPFVCCRNFALPDGIVISRRKAIENLLDGAPNGSFRALL